MEDGARRTFERLHRAGDELRPRLAEHLQRHMLRQQAIVDDLADEVEVRLRGGREAGLDLDEADVEQELEHAQLLVHIHGIDEGLVAVAQIDAAPARRGFEGAFGPRPVVQSHRCEGAVFLERHGTLAAAGRKRLRVHSHWTHTNLTRPRGF